MFSANARYHRNTRFAARFPARCKIIRQRNKALRSNYTHATLISARTKALSRYNSRSRRQRRNRGRGSTSNVCVGELLRSYVKPRDASSVREYKDPSRLLFSISYPPSRVFLLPSLRFSSFHPRFKAEAPLRQRRRRSRVLVRRAEMRGVRAITRV